MTEELADWPEPGFIDHLLLQHPAPTRPDYVNLETGEVIVGEPLWEYGIRLQGNQERVMKERWRFKQCGGGWRAGKSFIGAMHLYLDYFWRRYVRNQRRELWGVLADSYSMCEEEMRHLDRLLSEAGLDHEFRTPEGRAWSITFPDSGCEVRTLTATDVTKIASRPYRGIVIAEAAQTVEEAWLNAQGRVSQTRGWVLLEGTFESRKGPWYALKANEWMKKGAEGVFYSLPSWDNLVVYPGGREDPEILARERSMPPELFWEKYGGYPSKRSDLVMRYANERYQVRHRFPNLKTSYDPEQPVILFSDPGINHAYAVFAVQVKDNEVWVIDTVYRWGRGAEQIIQECASQPWAQNVFIAVMDFAARQRRAEGPPIVEQWASGWAKHVGHQLAVIAQPVPLQTGYDIHRKALLNTWDEADASRNFNQDGRSRVLVDQFGPKVFIDPAASAPLFGGVVDGVAYAGEYNLHKQKKNREGTVTIDDPEDTHNDAIKALNYGLYWYFSASGEGWKWFRIMQEGEAVPFSIEVA